MEGLPPNLLGETLYTAVPHGHLRSLYSSNKKQSGANQQAKAINRFRTAVTYPTSYRTQNGVNEKSFEN